MKTLSLTDATNDWRMIAQEIQNTGAPVALTIDGAVCGILLPPQEAARIVAHYIAQEQRRERNESARPFEDLPNYLDLLRADPSLVPVEDGERLEFLTMMNSSYVDPQQLYQFRHPRTRQIYLYRAEELQQAIGRTFVRVEFIPAHPKDYVEGKP
ncbi:MAG: hypothetical protein ACJ8CR_26840 [Roseiflexaceae bacterium]